MTPQEELTRLIVKGMEEGLLTVRLAGEYEATLTSSWYKLDMVRLWTSNGAYALHTCPKIGLNDDQRLRIWGVIGKDVKRLAKEKRDKRAMGILERLRSLWSKDKEKAA